MSLKKNPQNDFERIQYLPEGAIIKSKTQAMVDLSET